MKRIIYQLDTYSSVKEKEDWHSEPLWQQAMLKTSVPTVEKYANKIGVNYKLFQILENNSGNYDWQFAIKKKLLLFKYFAESEFDEMLYLDLDILVRDYTPSIFEIDEFKNGGFVSKQCIEKWSKEHSKRLKKNMNVDANVFYNGGVTLYDKQSAIKIANLIPEEKEFYGNKYDWLDNDETFLGYVLSLLDIRQSRIDHRWNYYHGTEKPFPENFPYFVHYSGPKGKEKLCKMIEPNDN
tara:strand:- start:30568 stop:31284 length:717 start_codon:yes stop_codon:yes gene_type:complete